MDIVKSIKSDIQGFTARLDVLNLIVNDTFLHKSIIRNYESKLEYAEQLLKRFEL